MHGPVRLVDEIADAATIGDLKFSLRVFRAVEGSSAQSAAESVLAVGVFHAGGSVRTAS